MGSLIELATWILVESAKTGRVRITAAAVCASFAAVGTLAALGCVAVALWIFALPTLGPVGAPLVVAAALLMVTLGLATAAWLILRQNQRQSGAATSPQWLLTEATRLLKENKGPALLAAVIAGMAAANGGRKP